jgi:hypothetical protein
MTRSVVGLVAALGAVASALAGLLHGDWPPFMVISAGIATGAAAFWALPGPKKILQGVHV